MKKTIFGLFLFGLSFAGTAQQTPVNYDESKIPPYTLPDLLVTDSGERITTVQGWEEIRRPELLARFADQMYGITPTEKIEVSYQKVDDTHNALDGMATRKQIVFTFTKGNLTKQATLLLYLPNYVKEKAAVFFAFNFKGNQAVHPDPAIRPTSETSRGEAASRWPLETIVSAGYGVATMDYNEFYPDRPDGAAESILPFFGYKEGEEAPGNQWQALGAWAWGMSRALDYFETDWQVDASRILLLGHSRLGKAALWAAAQDPRFALVISNCSGCGGAALSRRTVGETVEAVTDRFPYWFCRNFKQYSRNEAALPFDQHALIALIAPRPVYVASAEEDRWADPKGEFLSALYAGEVYRLYGWQGLQEKEMPPLNQPAGNRIGYHIRSGKHDVTEFDWRQYIRFADKWMK